MEDAEKFTSPANYVLDIDSNIVVVGNRVTVSRAHPVRHWSSPVSRDPGELKQKSLSSCDGERNP